MARKRMIDPEFWSDEQVGHWSIPARLFYIGLWNHADDEGRFKANDLLLKAQIFPYDYKVNIVKLKGELADKVVWYEVDQCQYGFIKNFAKHQRIDRPTESKLPKPPKIIDEASTSTQRGLAANIREVNIREEKLSKGANAPPADFIETLKANPAYKHIIIDSELCKMDAWLSAHKGRQKTKRFIVNWLNKIEAPIGPQKSQVITKLHHVPAPVVDEKERAKVAALISKTTKEMKGL